ncbi:MAG: 3-oxoacyl-[acyl-carrier-protein] reductase [Opitutales bacterium]
MHLTHNPRVALVTGAGRGIGKAIAERLAAHGHTVLCVSKSSTCEAVAADIVAKGLKAKAYQVDVSDPVAVAKACEAIAAEFGAVEILVNNAGITRDKLVMAMTEQDWNDVISTNLSSAFYWTKGLVRPMTRKRWGRIISISSVTGVQGNAGQANYAAAKAGLHGLTITLARELAGRSITANAVAPGFITTDMTDELPEEVKQKILSFIPLGRFGSVNDIAAMVDYLASEEGGYVTGQVFSIDGGMAI